MAKKYYIALVAAACVTFLFCLAQPAGAKPMKMPKPGPKSSQGPASIIVDFVWAEAVKWRPGAGADPGAKRYKVQEALGAPEPGRDGYDFLALGLGGYAVFDFGTDFKNTAVTYETTWNGGAGYPESASLFGAGPDFDFNGLAVDANGVLKADLNLFDASVFTYLGGVNNQAPGGVDQVFFQDRVFRYLVVLDTTTYGPSSDGFDLDAVGVQHAPIPGAIWLLGGGLLGLLWMRYKFSS